MIRRFLGDASAAATVEFVIWLPFFVALVGLVTDGTLLLQGQSRMYDVSRDGARQVAIGAATPAQAEDAMEAAFGNEPGYSANVTTDTQFVVAEITVPYSSVIVFGGFAFGSGTVTSRVTMMLESVAMGGTGT